MAQRILITGGAGAIASDVRPLLTGAGHDVVLLDIVAPRAPAEANERVVIASVTDVDALTAAFSGVDIVVHLAGYSSERPWHEILETNIGGTYAVLEAAHRAGVRRVLLASSIHAVGYASANESRAVAELTPRPDSFYGVGKVTLEALGRVYADRYGMVVVSARIGTAEREPTNARSLSTWLSPHDMVRLIDAVADHTEPGGHIVWGMSANERAWVSLDAGRAIGFEPEDDAESFAQSLGNPPPMPLDTLLAGGFIDDDHPLGQGS